MTSHPPISEEQKLEKFLSTLKIHNKDIDACLNDAVAVKHLKQLIQAYITTKEEQTEKAYGGCHNCYGKGYATVNDRWSGNGSDGDIGGFEGHVSGGNPNAMKFCTCDRGKQLEALITTKVEKEVREARIDELSNINYGCEDTEENDIVLREVLNRVTSNIDGRSLKNRVVYLQSQPKENL